MAPPRGELQGTQDEDRVLWALLLRVLGCTAGTGRRPAEAPAPRRIQDGVSGGPQRRRLLSEAAQGLAHGSVQGGGRVDRDARGTNAGFPAVKAAVAQSPLHGLDLRRLQIWGDRRQWVTTPSSAPRDKLFPLDVKPHTLLGEGAGGGYGTTVKIMGPGSTWTLPVWYQLWGHRQVTSLL